MSEWKVLKLPDCLEKTAAVTKIPKKKFLAEGQYPIVSQEKGVINGYWDEKDDVVKIERPLVVFGDHTQVLKHIDFDFVVGADGVKLLQPKSFLDSKYLFYFLMGNPVKTLGYARHYRLLKELDICFPNVAEQKRIVAILDEAFAGIDTAIANTEKNLANARELFESYLNNIFAQKGEGWSETTLSQATGGIFTGPFGSLLHKSDYVMNEIPLVNPAHITEVGIEADLRKTVSKETAQRLKNYIMREGDIVIGRRGEMGRCALVTEVENGWLCGTGSFFIKSSSQCDSRYLVRLLRSEGCKRRLEKIAGGAVMPNLSNTDLGNFHIDLPPLVQQTAVVQKIDDLHEETQRLKSIYQQKLNSLNELKQSLLQKAFLGQLTMENG